MPIAASTCERVPLLAAQAEPVASKDTALIESEDGALTIPNQVSRHAKYAAHDALGWPLRTMPGTARLGSPIDGPEVGQAGSFLLRVATAIATASANPITSNIFCT